MDEPRTAIDDALRRFAERDAPPAARPGPIAGPPRKTPMLRVRLDPRVQIGIVAAALLGVMVIIGGTPRPAAAPAPAVEDAPPAGRVAEVARAFAPPTEQPQAAPVAPTPLAVLAEGATAYAAPDGAALGDVSGREVLRYVERRDVSWVRADIGGDAGVVWLTMGALAGNAVDLAAIPCGGACAPGPMTMPTPTAPPYVAPAYVPPPPPKPELVVGGDGGNQLEVEARPTVDLASVPTARPNEVQP